MSISVKTSRFSWKIASLFAIAMAGLLSAAPTFAALTTGIEQGGPLQQALGLGSGDIRVIIANVIRIALGLLGVIAVSLMVYGGFLWMTSAGNEERVQKAKSVMINAVVGLVIILASYAITAFILSRLLAATGVGGDSSNPPRNPNIPPLSPATLMTVETVSPQGDQTIKNLTVRLTFSHSVDETTVASNIRIVPDGSTTPVVGTYTTSGDRVSFHPDLLCDGFLDQYCFTESTPYTITLGSGLKSTDNLLISCGGFYNPCSYVFTSGTLVDVTSPDVSISYPQDGDSVSVNALVPIQATATDDGGISELDFYADDVLVDSIQPTGDTPLSFTDSVNWDTSGITEGSRHTVYAVAYDVNDHSTTSDRVTVTVRAEHCFSGLQDEDETGEDCGGNDCGACGDDYCQTNLDCESGICVNNVCVDAPEITAISPGSGAVGTYVTISGNNFGSGTGSVKFGTVTADLANCTDAWSNSQVIVVVPASLSAGQSYSITLTTAGGDSDTNQNDNGMLINDFAVNATVHPGICNVSPGSGIVGSLVTVNGANFGATQGTSSAYFGASAAGSYSSWLDTKVIVSVPTLVSNKYRLSVYVGGVQSNTVNYTVQDADVGASPIIDSLNPSSGPIGQYVTITGSSFGSSEGTVYFINNDSASANYGVSTVADVTFPAVCENNFWGSSQIIVKVPNHLLDPEAADADGVRHIATNYLVSLTRHDTIVSNAVAFTVTTGSAGPGVCLLEPTAGPSGYVGVTIDGENFGSTTGTVKFFSDKNATVSSWSSGEVIVNVPSAAASGPVVLVDSSSVASNATNFDVGNCNTENLCDANTQQCCSTGICIGAGSVCPSTAPITSAYVWEFSTGTIPVVPTLVTGCTTDVISPTPWDGRSGGNNVCVNAALSATFTIAMDQTTFNSSNIQLLQCTGTGANPCDVTSPLTLSGITSTSTSFSANPTVALLPSTTYEVSLSSGITSATHTAIDPTTWTFMTSTSSAICTISGVNVVPGSATISEQNGEQIFNAQALASDACILLNSGDYRWTWSTDGSLAELQDHSTTSGVSCVGSPSSCQVIIGLQEGTSYARAMESTERVSDQAELTINFTDPYAIEYWPNCMSGGTACINAAIGATFNTPMNQDSIGVSGAVTVAQCTDQSCTSYVGSIPFVVALNPGDPATMNISPTASLLPTTYYRVTLSGNIVSASGVPLSEHYNGDFSFIFETRTDTDVCGINHVTMDPTSATVDYVGAEAVFDSVPYSDADSCSTSGERLLGADYNWSWTTGNASIATLVSGGTVQVASEQIPAGCTDMCLPAGTDSYTAVCGQDADGNGSWIDPGEECDGTAGCTATCVYSGTSAPTCGNGVVDIGEQCDDSGTASHDGCSSTCLNEGKLGGQTNCGDGVVTQLPMIPSTGTWAGGEDCDTADPATQNGCSSNCTYEGSIALAAIAGVCGNGRVEGPAEQCDGGAGCSDHCLFEGSSACTATVTHNCCGNGSAADPAGSAEAAAHESCDDGNIVNGDGCSSSCLLEGSSTTRTTPSWCGDAVVDVSESASCEVNPSDLDGKVEPQQVAVIMSTAPSFVVNGLASTTVSATTETKTGDALLNLTCSCQTDSQCSNPSTLGCGTGGCCYTRPEVSSYTPLPLSGGVCRNALVSLTFDQPMAVGSLTGNVVAAMTLGSTETCPYAATADGTCDLPLTFVQTDETNGSQLVELIYSTLLEADHTYTVTITGDASHTGVGVRSVTGVGLDANYTFTVDVGSHVCLFDTVSVEDTDSASSGLFTQKNEVHTYTATAQTTVGGVVQAIQPIVGVYDWDWNQTWWSTDTTVLSVPATGTSTTGDANSVTAVGLNGTAVIDASAMITTDTLFNPSTVGSSVSGAVDATANLCENSWPRVVDGVTWGPFEDSSTANSDPDGDGTVEITLQNGYTHFSTYYCRDAGDAGTTDDYAAADVVGVENPPSDVFKEYLFKMSGSDAIGIRVTTNTAFQSVSDWYNAQNFTGSPTAITVDGYPALQDGRTVYVSAANVNGTSSTGTIYPDIYVISYNAGASTETVAIFTQMLANWNFNTNLSNDELCYVAGEPVVDATTNAFQTCTSNLDCSAAATCSADKDKLTRDLTRLTDLKSIASDLSTYSSGHGRCSATVATSCTSDSECPGVETCHPLYPTIDSGSFLRSITTSNWDSWQSQLGDTLGVGSLAKDPLNQFGGCGVADGPYPNFDAATCWNESAALYVCPAGSHTYYYQNVGGDGYRLSTDLEYPSYTTHTTEWSLPIDTDTTDHLTIKAGSAYVESGDGYQLAPTCNGRAIGNSAVCGDGVIGAAETCEMGDTSTVSCNALTCVSADPSYDGRSCVVDCNNTALCSGDRNADGVCDSGLEADQTCGTGDIDCTDSAICTSKVRATGTQVTTCGAVCTAFVPSGDAACVPTRCGDGIIESGEDCDDGSHNGTYGYCGTDCHWDSTAFYCGDGTLAGGETCDKGVNNGAYTALAVNSCNAICSGPGTYCGDAIVNGGEQCDGAATWTGALCYGGADDQLACTLNSDCDSGVCGSGYQCILGSAVNCLNTADTTTCGTWGTCVATATVPVGFSCGATGTSLTACSGPSDTTTCGFGGTCGEIFDGAYACLLKSSTSCSGYGSGSAVGCSSGSLCADFTTYICDMSQVIACTGATDVVTCSAYNSALTCSGAGSDYAACGTGTVCEDFADVGDSCVGNNNCDSGACDGVTHTCMGVSDVGDFCSSSSACQSGRCSTFAYDLTRTRECNSSCVVGTWSSCARSGESCGNGTVEGDEYCDDGNTSNNDACTNDCTTNICGDGHLYTGVETCDAGSDNGLTCDSTYGSTCRYCSYQCDYLTASGSYCGDGVVNTPSEVCDATQLSQFTCYDSATNTVGGTCTSLGSTSSSQCASGFTCREVGVCSGGSVTGDYCTVDVGVEDYGTASDVMWCSSGAVCVAPTCAANCASTCPSTYSTGEVTVTSDEAGATPSSSISLYSSDSSSAPRTGTLTIPICSLSSSLSANISDSGRVLPNVDMMFIVDDSYSMSTALGSSTRLAVLRQAVDDAVNDLYEAYNGQSASMRIGFAYIGGTHGNDTSGNGLYSSAELKDFAYDFSSGSHEYFLSDDSSTHNKTTLLEKINLTLASTYYGSATDYSQQCYPSEESGCVSVQGTPLYGALSSAIDAFSSDPSIQSSDKKYIVLFTDGNIYNATGSTAATGYCSNDTSITDCSDDSVCLTESGTCDTTSRTTYTCNDGHTDCEAHGDADCPDVETTLGSETTTTSGTCMPLTISESTCSNNGDSCNPDTTIPNQDCLASSGTCVKERTLGELDRVQDVFRLSEPTGDAYVVAVSSLIRTAKNDDIEIFSGVLPSTDCDTTQSAFWSSDTCVADASLGCTTQWSQGNYSCSVGSTGITYAYSATTADGLSEMYQSIIGSVLNVTMTITDKNGNVGTGTLAIGDNIALPLPSNFSCDSAASQAASMQVTFNGSGSINFDNFVFGMCPLATASAASTTDVPADTTTVAASASCGNGVVDGNDVCGGYKFCYNNWTTAVPADRSVDNLRACDSSADCLPDGYCRDASELGYCDGGVDSGDVSYDQAPCLLGRESSSYYGCGWTDATHTVAAECISSICEADCTSDGFDGSSSDYSSSISAFCGDGSVDANDVCEGYSFCFTSSTTPGSRLIDNTVACSSSDDCTGMLDTCQNADVLGQCDGGIDAYGTRYDGNPCVMGHGSSSSYGCGFSDTNGSGTLDSTETGAADCVSTLCAQDCGSFTGVLSCGDGSVNGNEVCSGYYFCFAYSSNPDSRSIMNTVATTSPSFCLGSATDVAAELIGTCSGGTDAIGQSFDGAPCVIGSTDMAYYCGYTDASQTTSNTSCISSLCAADCTSFSGGGG